MVPLAVGISLIGVWGSYYGSDKLVITMTGAKVIQREDNPELFNVIEEVVIASGLPMPKVAIVVDTAPNAFATGRDPEHALIAFTTRILEVMDRDELQGVIAHEMSHVANRDTLVSAVAATTAGAIAILSDFLMRMMWFGGGRRDRDSNANPIALVLSLVVLILAPIAATLLKSAISRRRESLADATAVSFTRNPAGLRKALEVLAADSTVVHQKSNAVAHIWIESPLDGKAVSKMFSTHPPIEERIATLRAMESLGS
jgi:heat shock protein HtpX